jgi:hypothetical protein
MQAGSPGRGTSHIEHHGLADSRLALQDGEPSMAIRYIIYQRM